MSNKIKEMAIENMVKSPNPDDIRLDEDAIGIINIGSFFIEFSRADNILFSSLGLKEDMKDDFDATEIDFKQEAKISGEESLEELASLAWEVYETKIFYLSSQEMAEETKSEIVDRFGPVIIQQDQSLDDIDLRENNRIILPADEIEKMTSTILQASVRGLKKICEEKENIAGHMVIYVDSEELTLEKFINQVGTQSRKRKRA